jgi:hypothetical protein
MTRSKWGNRKGAREIDCSSKELKSFKKEVENDSDFIKFQEADNLSILNKLLSEVE